MTEENKKIVFVLGAGSSMSLSKESSANKMPSGRDLVEKISEYKLKATSMLLLYGAMEGKNIKLYNEELDIFNIMDFITEDISVAKDGQKCNPNNLKIIQKILSQQPDIDLPNNIFKDDILAFYIFFIDRINNNVHKKIADRNFIYLDIWRDNHYQKQVKDAIDCEIDYNYKTMPNEKSKSILKKLMNIKIAASVVEKYKPSSIDYFMTNLEDVASMEFLDIKGDGEKILARTKLIQEYTKLIINDILIKAQNEIIGDNKGIHNKRNYMFDIRDTILKKSTYHKQNFIEYAMKNVDVLNFNYDTTFDVLFTDRIPNFSNIKHIYGKITDDTKFDLFKYIVNSRNTTEITKELKWINEDVDRYKTKEIKEIISGANDIYFFGFGFDETNLLNIGFDKNNNAKKIFISNVNGRIINIIENLFDLERGIPIAKDNEFSLIMNHKIKTSGGGDVLKGGGEVIISERDKEQTFFISSKRLDGCFDDF